MLRLLLGLSALLLVMPPAHALSVFACEPEWGALVEDIAGSGVELTVATTARQDPHSLQARPSLIASVRSADLIVCTGADLEVGWLPLLLRRAGNPRVQPGNPGHFLAADFVRRLEVPESIDRAQGDLHPQGNPHVHLHPRNIARVAKALTDRLASLDTANAADYRANLEAFEARWDAARARWDQRASALAGLRVVSHHKSFSYLADWLDLDVVATLETKPGIPASGAHLARLLDRLSAAPPRAIIRTPYENEKPSLWLSQRLDVPAVVLPYTVGGGDDSTDLIALFDATLDRLEAIRE